MLEKIAKYPFLKDAKKWVEEAGVSVQDILYDRAYERARIRGKERLRNALDKADVGEFSLATEPECIMEILSYPIARMLATCVNDPYLNGRYSLAEARHAYKNLGEEPTSFIMDVAKEFGIDLEGGEDLKIHFTDYLKYSPTWSDKWKLVNRPLKKGRIEISKMNGARLIQEALKKRIHSEIVDARPSKEMMDVFKKEILMIKNELMMREGEEVTTGKASIAKFPPCMKKLLGAVQSGMNVPHVGRFALVAFLHSIGLKSEEILGLFSTSPDFNEGKTRYQIEHITGKISSTEYAPPQCQTMRSWGICFGKDELCKKINHPTSYHKERWKSVKKKKDEK